MSNDSNVLFLYISFGIIYILPRKRLKPIIDILYNK